MKTDASDPEYSIFEVGRSKLDVPILNLPPLPTIGIGDLTLESAFVCFVSLVVKKTKSVTSSLYHQMFRILSRKFRELRTSNVQSRIKTDASDPEHSIFEVGRSKLDVPILNLPPLPTIGIGDYALGIAIGIVLHARILIKPLYGFEYM
jgi:hypothetical protein